MLDSYVNSFQRIYLPAIILKMLFSSFGLYSFYFFSLNLGFFFPSYLYSTQIMKMYPTSFVIKRQDDKIMDFVSPVYLQADQMPF